MNYIRTRMMIDYFRKDGPNTRVVTKLGTEEEYVFTAKSFIDFLVHKNDFKQYAPVEMRVRLQQLGAHKEGAVWRMPEASIPKTIEPTIDIDFRNKVQEEEDF